MENINNLEVLKKKLYKKEESFASRAKRKNLEKSEEEDIASDWQDADDIEEPGKNKKKNFNFFRFLIYLSVFFLLGVGGLSGYIWYAGVNIISSSNVSVEISGPVYVDGGQLAKFNLTLKNDNTAPLESADLILDFPENSFSPAGSKLSRQRINIGKIEPGSLVSRSLDVAIFGLENEEKVINASLEYRLADSNAIFAKDSQYMVKISKAPFGLSVTAPKESPSGQKIPIKIEIVSNSESVAKKLRLEVKYPPGFKFISADIKPSEDNNVWNLGDIGSNQKRTITLMGIVEGQDMEERAFVASVGTVKDDGSAVSYGVATEKVIIKKSPLGLTVYLNSQDSDKITAYPGDSIIVEAKWANNLSESMRNIQIELEISGAAFDERSATVVRGYQGIGNKKIIWNQTSIGDLAEVAPGQSDKTQMSFSIKNPLPIKTGSDKNFYITIIAKATGTGTSNQLENQEVSSLVEKKIIIASKLQAVGRTLYYSGPFKNSGPIPPKAGSQTTYTIAWSLANNVNDLSGVKVSAFLPPYVKFLNFVNPADADIKFDEKNSSIVWNAGDILSGAGVIFPAREAAFKVALSPDESQSGSNPSLVGATRVEARDDFASNDLSLEIPALTTKLDNDPLFKGSSDTVK